jgi:glutathione peroxidase
MKNIILCIQTKGDVMNIYDFKVKNSSGEEVSLKDYKGKTLLIVNTASQCGFTPQYDELEALHEKYADKDFAVLGFPCNQFGGQEPGSDEEIQQFCTMKFGIKFPVFSKIDVNGSNAHPLYEFLKEKAPGVLGSKKIKWNFTKFLVSPDGEEITRFAPATKPSKIESDIQKYVK